ncbi:P27 family phage terminase small subunit, partial [Escherichia coli]|uniref:P27 family phage terminase small subunit n=1 Tax=Escherichia coli TaxID=562 RepID=UPI003EE14995
FEGLPRIKCRRGGVFGGPDIIGFTYQSFNHIPKKSFRTCGDAMKADAWKRIRAMLAEFGMSPASRAKVNTAGPDNVDPLAELL